MQPDRIYRDWTKTKDLIPFKVVEGETDLFVLADKPLNDEALKLVKKYRKDLQGYIRKRPEFKDAITPIEEDSLAPEIAQHMIRSSRTSGVGPMAGVAGALSEYVGRGLLEFSKEVLIENGGDIFLKTAKCRTLGIFAGESKFTKKLGLKVEPQDTPLGLCTSSGKVGHSLSFGMTDAAVIISKDTVLSDCVATKVGNLVKASGDLNKGIDFAKSIKGILGVVIIIEDKLASWGKVELVST